MQTINDLLPQYDEKFSPVGQTLPHSVRAYRVEVLLAFAQAGIPLNKICTPGIQQLLEHDRSSLGGVRALRDLSPMLEMLEFKRLIEEDLANVKEYSCCWDATFRFAEVWAMLVYYFDGRGRRQKRLISLRLLKGSMTGPETCAVVLHAVQQVSLKLEKNLFTIFDRCAVNYSASDMLGALAPDSSAIGCMSHTTSGVGDRAVLPLVKSLVEALNIATHSIGARGLFQAEFGEVMEGHSDTRWYCTYHQARQVHSGFSHLLPWLRQLGSAGYVPQTVAKLRAVVVHCWTLQLELSVMVDSFAPFVAACHTLEGDAAVLVFRVHSDWLALQTHVAACRATTALACTTAVAREIVSREFPRILAAGVDQKVTRLLEEALSKVEPAFAHFDAKTVELKHQLKFHEAATMFHPLLVQQTGLSEAQFRSLVEFIPPLNKPATVTALLNERERYVTECMATPAAPWQECDVEALWAEGRFRRLSSWHDGGRAVMLAQPSSAPMERVFSMLQTVVCDQQGRGLSDYQAGSMMTYYNTRERE